MYEWPRHLRSFPFFTAFLIGHGDVYAPRIHNRLVFTALGAGMRQQQLSALVCGLLFAIGLGVSGMTQPQKVIGFLDVFGAWDPSLLFVMVGGLLVYGIGYRWVKKIPKPLFAPQFLVPSSRQIDNRLLMGAALFGIGWGIAGFCPGPALASLVTLNHAPLIFGISMILTVLIFEWVQNKKERGS